MEPPKYPSRCVERFLEYVTIDTQSSEDSESYPSTPGQLDLLRVLVDELSELGLEDVAMEEHGYVFATIQLLWASASVRLARSTKSHPIQPMRLCDGSPLSLPFGCANIPRRRGSTPLGDVRKPNVASTCSHPRSVFFNPVSREAPRTPRSRNDARRGVASFEQIFANRHARRRH